MAELNAPCPRCRSKMKVVKMVSETPDSVTCTVTCNNCMQSNTNITQVVYKDNQKEM